jgi:hypothetical protein
MTLGNHARMKILIVGRCDGWMGIHMGHFSEGFRNLGHEVRLIDYHECGKVRFPRLLLGESRAAHQRRSTEHLKGLILQFKPLLIILVMAHLDFDFSEIRRFFSGSVVFYDMDGPALPCYAEGLQWIREIDLLASVSQLTVHELKARGINNTHYLPHAVDTHYYAPLPLSRVEKKRFGALLSFVGRPTDRRERLLESVASEGLAIWGRRWSKRKYVKNPKLAQCFREKKMLSAWIL